MAFARPKTDVNDEGIGRHYTEYSDVIRAKNKREDRLLDVQLKFYEREKNIRLNIIRKEQCQIERVRTSLVEQAKKIQDQKQNLPLPTWMSPRFQSDGQIFLPEFDIDDLESNSDFNQSEIIPADNIFLTTTEPIRRDNLDSTSDLIQSEIIPSYNLLPITEEPIRRHSTR